MRNRSCGVAGDYGELAAGAEKHPAIGENLATAPCLREKLETKNALKKSKSRFRILTRITLCAYIKATCVINYYYYISYIVILL